MTITKSFLRHEIQNLLMVLGFQLEDTDFENKEKLLPLIKLISLFTEYEDYFLTSDISFHSHEILVEDLFEIIKASVSVKSIEVGLQETSGSLHVDREHIIKALVHLFIYLSQKLGKLVLSFDSDKNVLSISHSKGAIDLVRESLHDVLKKGRDYDLISFQLALHLLHDFGCDITSEDNLIDICFSS